MKSVRNASSKLSPTSNLSKAMFWVENKMSLSMLNTLNYYYNIVLWCLKTVGIFLSYVDINRPSSMQRKVSINSSSALECLKPYAMNIYSFITNHKPLKLQLKVEQE